MKQSDLTNATSAAFELFEKTGSINYYLFYKELKKQE